RYRRCALRQSDLVCLAIDHALDPFRRDHDDGDPRRARLPGRAGVWRRCVPDPRKRAVAPDRALAGGDWTDPDPGRAVLEDRALRDLCAPTEAQWLKPQPSPILGCRSVHGANAPAERT